MLFKYYKLDLKVLPKEERGHYNTVQNILEARNREVPTPTCDGYITTIYNPLPCIIQPGEIKTIHTGLVISVESGTLLLLSSPTNFANKKLELTSPFIFSGGTGPLYLAIKNNDSSFIQLKPNDPLALGHFIQPQPMELSSLEKDLPLPTKRSSSKKKATGIKFNIT